MALFRRRGSSLGERPVPPPDWDALAGHLAPDEQQVGASSGWTVGKDLDHPCTLYLTDRAVYLHVKPDTVEPASLTVVPLAAIAKAAVGTSDTGTPRLVVMYDLAGRNDPADVEGFGVDLRPASTGRSFASQVVQRWEAERG